MNPALDITTNTDAVVLSHKMRCGAARYDPGGGGINVARVANVLGASVSAVFAAGGPAGDLIADLLGTELPLRRVPIAGSTRESLTVTEDSTGRQYRFVLPGAPVSFAEQAECLNQLRRRSRRRSSWWPVEVCRPMCTRIITSGSPTSAVSTARVWFSMLPAADCSNHQRRVPAETQRA